MLNFQFVWICIYREQASVHTEGCRADLVGIEWLGCLGCFQQRDTLAPRHFCS